MIPEIGLMVAGYIIFRCVEVMCRPATAFGSRGQQILVCIIGWVGIVATSFLAANLLLESSATVGTAPRTVFEMQR